MQIIDTNVLIDYLDTNSQILGIYSQNIETLVAPRSVKGELNPMKAALLPSLGIEVHTESLEQLASARDHNAESLSFVDRVCLFVAKDLQVPCITNDVALRTACSTIGVPVLWGFDLMLTMVERQMLEVKDAIETAKAIQQEGGPIFYPDHVVRTFTRDVRQRSKKRDQE